MGMTEVTLSTALVNLDSSLSLFLLPIHHHHNQKKKAEKNKIQFSHLNSLLNSTLLNRAAFEEHLSILFILSFFFVFSVNFFVFFLFLFFFFFFSSGRPVSCLGSPPVIFCKSPSTDLTLYLPNW